MSKTFWLFWAVSMSEYVAVLVLGRYLRARRQLVASLRARVDEAVAAQRALADQARLAERTRIATEMHDVLAQRVSLIAMHAGALEIRPDQSPDEVLQAAGLIRTTVTVEGGPGAGLNVTVRNKLPLNYTSPALPGSGLGLVGLGERVALAGGALFHGPEPGGDFVLRAALRWESDRKTDRETGE
jgi:signal transduction histidine kinase